MGYIRVSTAGQVEGTSLKTQKETLERFCKQREHSLAHIFTDEGLSGKRGSIRPQYANMLKRLDTDKEVEGIIVTSLSRLGRSITDVVGFVYRLKDENRIFIAIKESIDMSTKEGRMFFGMMASINEYERELIAERMAEGRAYAEQHGTKSGKPCHRPEKVIDWEKVQRLRDQKLSWGMIARVLAADPATKVSGQTLINQARKKGMKI